MKVREGGYWKAELGGTVDSIQLHVPLHRDRSVSPVERFIEIAQ